MWWKQLKHIYPSFKAHRCYELLLLDVLATAMFSLVSIFTDVSRLTWDYEVLRGQIMVNKLSEDLRPR